MAINLRPYQIDLIDRVRKSMKAGNRRVLMQLPTGGGKTLVASEILKLTTLNGYNSIFVADRRKLIDQTAEKLDAYGVDNGIIMAGKRPNSYAPVQVASIQTLYSRAVKRQVMELPDVQLVIIDEAHKSLGNQYFELIMDHYPEAYVLGLTATPVRADGRGLGEMYDDLVLGPRVNDLVDEGFLVPMRYYAPSVPDMQYLETIYDKRKGDYNEVKLGQYMERNKPLIGNIVEHYKALSPDRQAVVFASSVRHSMYVAEAFNKAGIPARHIDGTTYHLERAEIYEQVHSGKVRVLTNYGVLVEGWDEPQISTCILARPTKSLATYLQMAGRVLRPFPGKGDALLIDHSGVVRELGFVSDEHPWSLDPNEAIEEREARLQEGLSEEQEEKTVKIVCEQCDTVYEGQRKCPDCGWEPPKRKSKAQDYLEAALVEVMAERKERARRQDWFEKAIGYARLHNMGKNWAVDAYKMKFKEEPPKAEKVGIPDQEIKNWHTHMIIREKYSRKSNRAIRKG